ncbi:hypothetical protein ABKN59_000458 [Abortiporus biennis]
MDNFEDDTSHTLQEGSSIAPSSPVMPPSSSTLADAFERRLRQQREQQQQERARESYHAWDENHEKRQEFRRLIDPGILRPNPRHIALEALYTLQKLSDNILEHPDEPKYQRFKPTNPKIKATLVDPKGTLEYAVALGFRPEVQNFQPYYVWHKRRMNELQVGNAILKEMLELETSKEERLAQAKKEEKAIAEAAKAKVKQAFMDDRKSKAMQDRRERELRNIHEAATRRTSSSPPSSPATRVMPGSGHTLHESSSYQDDD